MVDACIDEFIDIDSSESHVMDDHASAIEAAKNNGFSTEIIEKAEKAIK